MSRAAAPGHDVRRIPRGVIQARLHDEAGPAPAEARVFVAGENRWRDFERWPPTEHIAPTRLYLHPDRKLRFEPPRESGPRAFDEYVSDPDSSPAAAAPPATEGADRRGYQLMIGGEVVRARYRSSFAKPEPVVPGAVLRYEVPLHSRAHVFGKGHRIAVQVQSTWFPLIDRNPQRFVPSIFSARASDYVKATQRISRSREAPSAIVLPLLVR